LIDEEIDPGTAKIFWDGRDHRGAGAASGLYFARVSTEHKTINVRMMMVK
jgi:hypothetical protein